MCSPCPPALGFPWGWENEVQTPRVPGRVSSVFQTNAFSKEPILEDLKSFGNQVSLPPLPISSSVGEVTFEKFVGIPVL